MNKIRMHETLTRKMQNTAKAATGF